MIQPAAPALVSLLAAAPSPSGVGGESGLFALSLAGFLDAGEASAAIPSDVPQPRDERQGDVDDGNILPGEADADVEINATVTDPALAWLAILAPIAPPSRPIAFTTPPPSAAPIDVVPVLAQSATSAGNPSFVPAAPATDSTSIPDASVHRDKSSALLARLASADGSATMSPPLPRPAIVARPDPSVTQLPEPVGSTAPFAVPSAEPKPIPAPVPPSVLALIAAAKAIVLPSSPFMGARALPEGGLPGGIMPKPDVAAPAVATGAAAATDVAPIARTARDAGDPLADADPAPRAIVALPERMAKTTAASSAPAPLPESTPPAPAVAAALAGAVRSAAVEDRPAATARRNDEPALVPVASSSAETRGVAVAATGDAQQAPLDLSQQRWTHTIIDRIERLRDGIDAADTRIRLVPDALGSIDVSVRKEGDTLHVHFAAEQAATRTILQDAQPRLAEIAESRGLKLGQSAVGGGGADTGRQPSQPQQSRAPQPAPVRVAGATDSTNARIA